MLFLLACFFCFFFWGGGEISESLLSGLVFGEFFFVSQSFV